MKRLVIACLIGFLLVGSVVLGAFAVDDFGGVSGFGAAWPGPMIHDPGSHGTGFGHGYPGGGAGGGGW